MELGQFLSESQESGFLGYLNREMRRYKNKKQELKAVTNNMDEGMLFLDTKWNIASLNKSAIKFFGKDKEELVHKNILELIQGEDIRKLLQQMELVGKGTGR